MTGVILAPLQQCETVSQICHLRGAKYMIIPTSDYVVNLVNMLSILPEPCFCQFSYVLVSIVKTSWSLLMNNFPGLSSVLWYLTALSDHCLTIWFEVCKQYNFCIQLLSILLLTEKTLNLCRVSDDGWFQVAELILNFWDYHFFGTLKWHISRNEFYIDAAEVQEWL